jgi:hypothetical protein
MSKRTSSYSISFDKGTVMKKEVIINDLTKQDMCDILYEALEQVGIEPGMVIPSQLLHLRESILLIMFGKGESR